MMWYNSPQQNSSCEYGQNNNLKFENMATFEKYFPKVLKWEGGYVNDPADSGGATKYGVTAATWAKFGDGRPITDITPNDAKNVCKRQYWDLWQADKINNQSVAEMLVDWVWGSGYHGIKIPQRVLGVAVDGRVGNQTLSAINGAEPKELFDKLKQARIDFLHSIVKANPKNQKFLKGWLNRVNDFQYSENE